MKELLVEVLSTDRKANIHLCELVKLGLGWCKTRFRKVLYFFLQTRAKKVLHVFVLFTQFQDLVCLHRYISNMSWLKTVNLRVVQVHGMSWCTMWECSENIYRNVSCWPLRNAKICVVANAFSQQSASESCTFSTGLSVFDYRVSCKSERTGIPPDKLNGNHMRPNYQTSVPVYHKKHVTKLLWMN